MWVLISLAVMASGAILSAIHTVREGHVGVYWRGGALLNEISEPGYHLKIPLITQFEEVQVTIQTDEVRHIPCGTSGGVLITFDKVTLKCDEVVDIIE